MNLQFKEVKTKEDAQANADLLAEFMTNNMGGMWETRVWENLGWHWQVKIGSIGLYYHPGMNGANGKYSAMINSEKNKIGGAPAYWHDNEDQSENPVAAVKNAMTTAQNFVNRMQDVIDDNFAKMFD